jgi:hypothetical protein
MDNADQAAMQRIRHQAENPTNYDNADKRDPVDLFRKRWYSGEVDLGDITDIRAQAVEWGISFEATIRRLADMEYERDNPDVTLIYATRRT